MEPKTLQAAIEFFADAENCRQYMIARRWADGVVRCPRCNSDKVKYSAKYDRWQCGSHHERRQFTLKTGTIFEDSPLPLKHWLTAMWMLVNCKNGVSSWEIHRAIGVTQKSAWFMLHRLREVLQPGSADTKLGGGNGGCEVDETFVGPNPKNMHRERRVRYNKQRYDLGTGRTIVMGILDRDARQIRAKIMPNTKRDTLQNEILNNVSKGSSVFTDSAVAYDKLSDEYIHQVVNHAVEYVRGNVHTNGLENFWSLLKRTLRGTYVAIEPFHLDRYLGEQVYRYNNRATKDNPLNDNDRFVAALTQVVGQRLTYKELTGKVGTAEAV
jgi:transposase-like protein